MKILFLHLSDLHLKTENAVSVFHIEKILDTLRETGKFDRMIMILSGDISFSGKEEEYSVANKLITAIFKLIKKKDVYKGYINVICVPGNHDIDHGEMPLSCTDLNKICKEHTYREHLNSELDKLNNFFDFAHRRKCFTSNALFDQRIIKYPEYKIEVNMINTAAFSIKRDEDKGMHYIDQASINLLNTPTGADFVITVMHHSYDWYIDIQKDQLEKAILCKSSLLFAGHEHRIGSKRFSYDDNAYTFFHAGGALCENDDWSKSEFEVSVLDTDTSKYSLHLYKWNQSQGQYETSTSTNVTLPSKPSVERKLTVTEAFKENMTSSPLKTLSNKIEDFYVFPRIETDSFEDSKNKEFVSIESFVEEIVNQKRILLTGSNGCGKTALLKQLFLRLSKEKCVVFCDIDTIKNKESRKIVKSNFEEIYGDNYSDYERFKQLPPENKVLIIDDIDQIKSTDFEKYISSIADEFGLMIFATKNVIDLDMIERVKRALDSEQAITRYKITPFYADKREELIRKVVSIKNKKDPTINIDETVELLCKSIKQQKQYMTLAPEFIINFAEYYCNNIGTVSSSDSTVFSKVFEANITAIFQKYQTKTMTVQRIYKLFSMLAYNVHFRKKYPFDESDIIQIVADYNKNAEDDLEAFSFVEIINKTQMLTNDCGKYKFANRNHLAYFVAREVNFLYNETGDEKDLRYILANACFGINSDILLFISYITDNTRILQLFLALTQQLTDGWREFDLDNNVPTFLNIHKTQELDAPPSENALKESKEKEIKSEKESLDKLTTIDIYDYKEEDADLFINQVLRSLTLLTVISKSLPSFEHNMSGELRKAFVQEIYSLPNKIYGIWAEETDKGYKEMIEYLKENEQLEYNDLEPGKLSEVEIKFQISAINLLLDIYNLAVAFSTKDNSYRFLDKFDRGDITTYHLQHLMMMENQKMSSEFVSTAIDIAKEREDILSKLLVQKIVRHAMVYMPSLGYKERGKLVSQFFSKEGQRGMLLQRTKEAKNKH